MFGSVRNVVLLDGAFHPLSLSGVKEALRAGAADVNMLILGDSTGDATSEWPYLLATWLGEQYPAFSVDYRLWNDGTDTYGTATSIQTGSGANTLTLYNASISGSNLQHLVGAKFAPAIMDVAPDLIIWSHGHNTVDDYTDPALLRGKFLIGMENVRLALPNVPQCAFRQNPRRDDDQMTPVVAALDAVAKSYGGVALFDVYSRFIAQGKATGLYADNVHPSAAGQQLYLTAIQDAWQRTGAGSFSVSPAFLETETANLLANGDFSDWPGALPVGWTGAGSPTATKELVIVDAGAAQSLKLTGTTAQANIQQSFTAGGLTPFLGEEVTLAVRQFVPSGSAGTVGRIAILYTSGGNVSSTTRAYTAGQGGWRWMVISGVAVPANATLLRVFLYCDTAANASSAAYYDRAILVTWRLPRNMASPFQFVPDEPI